MTPHLTPVPQPPQPVSYAIAEADRRFSYFVESVTEYALFTLAPDGVIVSWNAGAQRTFGYADADILGKNFSVLFTPDEIANAQPVDELCVALREGRIDRDCWHVRADGSLFWATNTVQPVRDDNGSLIGFSKIVRDSTERYLAGEALRESEERFRLMVENVGDYAILSISPDGNLSLWNGGAEHIFGYGTKEILGSHIARLFTQADIDLGVPERELRQATATGSSSEERWYRRKDGTRFFATVRITRLASDSLGNEHGFVMVLHDITDRKYLEESMRHKAFYDKLTGLPNRALFFERLARVNDKGNGDYGFGLLLIDLDDFKLLNDKFSHAAADLLLIEIARRLERLVRPEDLVARLSGDEFAILLACTDSPATAVEVAERVRLALSTPVTIRDTTIALTASIGIAYGSRYDRLEQALRDADVAMYEAKARGRNQVVLYDDSMRRANPSRRLLEAELQQGINGHEFFVQYQPIVGLRSLSVAGFEALVRWRHPQRGILLPAEFLPAAEQAGSIIELDRRTFETAARNLSSWQRRPQHSALSMSVNFSTKGLTRVDTLPAIVDVMQRHPTTPGSLRIEITESVLMETSEQVVKTISGLRDLGLEFHLDDFGTGYSGLTYLRRAGATTLKIDRSFVSGMANNEGNAELVRAIISLAHTLRLQAVAEGVETEEEMLMLQAANCDYAQGYFFGVPIDAPEATDLISA